MLRIIQHKKIFLSIAGILVAASACVVAVWGLPLGIDFTGGSLLEATYEENRPANNAIRSSLEPLVGSALVQPTGERGVLIRFRDVDEATHQAVLAELESFGSFREDRFESVGPAVGRELRSRAATALAIVSVLIVLYIAWAFRRVSKPIASWKYGVVAVAALIHDIAVPTGVVAVLGRFGTFQVDAFFVTALLTILGFSVHDTIVIFDRIRENLRGSHAPFDEVAEQSIRAVLGRSINTSLTLFFVLIAVFLIGGSTTHNLALVLMLGVIFGTYSSIFVASPLLTVWARAGNKK